MNVEITEGDFLRISISNPGSVTVFQLCLLAQFGALNPVGKADDKLFITLCFRMGLSNGVNFKGGESYCEAC